MRSHFLTGGAKITEALGTFTVGGNTGKFWVVRKFSAD